jgi:hypothetical protein
VTAIANSSPPLALGHAVQDYGRRFQWLSPMLIGTAAPLIFALFALPTSIDGARPFIGIVLCAVVVVGAGAAILTLMLKGDVMGLIVDPTEKVIQIYTENAFGTNIVRVPFQAVSRIYPQERRDEAGYSYTGATVETKDGKAFEVLAALSSEEIDTARHLIGMTGPARRTL